VTDRSEDDQHTSTSEPREPDEQPSIVIEDAAFDEIPDMASTDEFSVDEAPAEVPTEEDETGGMWAAAAAADEPVEPEVSGESAEGGLSSFYDRVPEYDGSDEPQGLIEDEEPEEPPLHDDESSDDSEAPDEGFLRALMEADDEEEDGKKGGSE
jgi:hypothetical protein